jgi:hypothetical protein
MITTFTIPVDGGTYTFGNSNVVVNILKGFAAPSEPKLGQHEYSYADGGLLLSQFYKTRRITIGGELTATDIATFASARRDLQRAFVFDNAEKLLQFTTDDGLNLQCNVIAATQMSLDPVAGAPTYAMWQIDLDMADPLFYAQSSTTTQGGITTVTGGVIIPVTIPVTLSATITGSLSLNNGGTAKIYPDSVTIQGPGTDFIISNKTTGEDFLYNDTLLSTDSVVFNFKRRIATKNGSTDVYGFTSGTWWRLVKGSNTVTFVVGSGNTSNTQLTAKVTDAYWGV